MDNLDILIGFSVIMLIVAQISTFGVEIWTRFFHSRDKEFAAFQRGLKDAVDKVGEIYQTDVDHMKAALNNRFKSLQNAEGNSQPRFKHRNINVPSLLESMASSAGHAALSGEAIATLEDQFAQEETTSTQRYRQRCTYISFGAALLFSFLFNVDSIHIFQTLQNKPVVLAQTVELANNRAILEGQIAIAELDQNDKSEVERQLREIKHKLAALKSSDLNIRWWLTDDQQLFEDDSKLGMTIIGWLITGLFAGLGAPFWQRTLNQLVALKATTSPGGDKAKRNRVSNGHTPPPSPQFPQSGLFVRSGKDGGFNIKNAVFDPEKNSLTVDVDVVDRPQAELWSNDELKQEIRRRSEVYCSGIVREVVIRENSENQIRHLMAIEQF